MRQKVGSVLRIEEWRGYQEFLGPVDTVMRVEASRRPSLRRLGKSLWAITPVRLRRMEDDDELHQRAEIRVSLELSESKQKRRGGYYHAPTWKTTQRHHMSSICLISKRFRSRCGKVNVPVKPRTFDYQSLNGKLTCNNDKKNGEQHCQKCHKLKAKGLCSAPFRIHRHAWWEEINLFLVPQAVSRTCERSEWI